MISMSVQVLYNAQMIRTWSLLLRNAQRLGYIVSGRQVSCLSALYQHICQKKSPFTGKGICSLKGAGVVMGRLHALYAQ